MNFEPKDFRQQFPFFQDKKQLNIVNENNTVIYFDNGATTQKPACVIECYQEFYQAYNANVHRASHALSAKATTAFEKSRTTVQKFINAKSSKEIIWTKGTTEGINLLAHSLASQSLIAGDEILISVSEHHANIVPWQLAAQRTGAIIKVLPLDSSGCIDMVAFEMMLTTKTKIVCCAQVSNILGKVNPIENIITKAKKVGAITIIDGAQAIAHFPVDVQALACDFYVFSAHKMYGPTGVGVLYGKQALLEAMPPYQSGGEMIKTVSFNQATTFNELPFKFEAGTPNIAGIIAFSRAINFISQFHGDELADYELQLIEHCYSALEKLPKVKFVTSGRPDIPVIAFTVEGHHNHDIASALDSFGIAIRSGHHCAMPLMEYLSLSGCLRVSMAPYNTVVEIDYFIACLQKTINGSTNTLANSNSASGRETFTQVTVDNTRERSIAADIGANPQISDEEIVELFGAIQGWHNRHREIMLLSKQLPRLDKSYRNEASLIQGCESLAWLVVTSATEGVLHFQADSDAKVIRGLLVIVLAAFNGKTKTQIANTDIEGYFSKLGLLQQLSPSRGNGLLAIVDKIKLLAKQSAITR